MKRFGIKMPNKVRSPRLRICPVCSLPKYRKDFRQSNRNPAFNIICWQCRHDDARCEAKFHGVKTRRLDSDFRRKFYAIKRLLKKNLTKKEVMTMGNQIAKQSMDLIRFPERVAAILGKTYAVRGDDPNLMPDDEALTRIRDLLEELDDTIIERNKNKRLSR